MLDSVEHPRDDSARRGPKALLRSRTARLLVAGGLLAVVGAGMAAQAQATSAPSTGSEDLSCSATYQLNLSPGVTRTAAKQDITGTITPTNCFSPDNADTAVIKSITFTGSSASVGCGGVFTSSGTATANWSTGDTSDFGNWQYKFNVNAQAPQGTQVTGDSSGSSVSGGDNAGDKADFTLTTQNATGSCADGGAPVTQVTGVLNGDLRAGS